MQILPSMNATKAKAGLEALGGLNPAAYRKQAKAFSSYFDACLSGDLQASGQDATSVTSGAKGAGTSNAAGNKAALTANGLLSSGSGNVVSDPKNVRMSKEDFAQLKESLQKSGISDKDLEELEARIDTPEGLTWGGFMSFLQTRIANGQEAAGLSVEDKRQVQSLLGKLGFTPGETSDLISRLEQGQSTGVWGTISGRLASLSSDTSLNITPDEAKSLARALGLSQSAQTRLGELVSGLGDAESGSRNVKTALLAIAAEVKDQDRGEAQALAQVKDLASQVFVAAQKREFGQSLSDAREDQVARKALLAREMAADGSGEAKDARITGNKSVADMAFAFRDATGKGGVLGQELDDESAIFSGEGRAAAARGSASGQAGDGFAQNGIQGDSGQGRQNGAQGFNQGRDFGKSGRERGEGSGSNRQDTDGASDADWAGFWSKVGVEGRTAKAHTATEASATLAGLSSQAGAASQTVLAASAKGADSSVSSDVLRQVETGMFQNLGQGANRLTLNLSPDELGAVNIMLTVKDKDVQAVIKTETPEAARIIGDQLNRVREQLEQQGLKVSKLEVQTGLSQQQEQAAWQGAGQHNEARRQQEELSMMRTAVRLLGTGSSASPASGTTSASAIPTPRNEGVDVFA